MRKHNLAKVTILVEGYARRKGEICFASSTAVLIQAEGKNIVADPGINRKFLLKKLKQRKLELNDIDFVFLTHNHLDHCLLSGIFERAKILDNSLIYEEDKESEHRGTIPKSNIEIIATPGHDQDHAALIVQAEEGKVAVTGDLFWWWDNQEQNTRSRLALLSLKDPFVEDQKTIEKSRKKILKIADWIIPGHGKIFRNPGRKK